MIDTKFWLSFLTLVGLFSTTQVAQAQTYQPTNRAPVSDNTLGTQVSGAGGNFNITGGVSKGQTLFHSFTDFSVPTNGQANFLNPVGNRDIITRVTGNLFSDINGLVNTNGVNFFLINPSGIVFGPNAQLNVGKAFVGSTANSIDLVGGGRTITFGTNPNGDAPLLSVAPNVLFDVARLNLGGGAGAISNFGTLQTTNPNQYIGLIGGNVNLNGGQINAPGGRVELGGLSVAGAVGLSTDGNNLRAQFPTNVGRGDVTLTNQAGINVTGTGGGDIAITARNISLLTGSSLRGGIDAELGTPEAVAGDIKLNAIEKVAIIGSGGVIANSVNSNATGQGGNIIIDAGSVLLQDRVVIGASTFGQGNAGNINIRTTGDLTINGNNSTTGISSNSGGQGNTGKITIDTQGNILLANSAAILAVITAGANGDSQGISITAKNLNLLSNSLIGSNSFGDKGNAGNITIKVSGVVDAVSGQIGSTVGTGTKGNGGNIAIDAGSISLKNGAGLRASTSGTGNAGNVTVTAKKAVSLIGGNIFSSVEAGGVGKGGNIDINAGSLSLTDSALLSTNIRGASDTQPAGRGDAGNINIRVSGAVDVAGSKNGFITGISSTTGTGTVGNGGNLTVEAGSFSLKDSAKLLFSTSGTGNGGNIKINATGDVSINGNKDGSGRVVDSSSVSSSLEQGAVGIGGNIEINARNLSVTNAARLLAGTNGQGNAGNIKIIATGDVSFDGNKDGLTSAALSQVGPSGVGKAGNIDIDSRNLSVINGAGLSTTTRGKGDAGSIKIKAKNNIFLDGKGSGVFSTVASNALGKGGKIEINSSNLNINNQAQVNTSSLGQGPAGDIVVNANKIVLNTIGRITSTSLTSIGGDLNITAKEYLLLRNNSSIDTNSLSTAKNGNGGNITISSPVIVATPGNNDITANANRGAGGQVKITSQGLFGIQYRPEEQVSSFAKELRELFGIQYRSEGQASPLTNDITASSTFGRDGAVNVSTPGTDPGKDSTKLPNVTTDASNQISQVCGANSRENKLTVTGRGGLPPTANDPLTSDVVWQDARAVSSQPVATNPKTNPAKLAAPAVGLVFDGKGKVTLVAAGTQGQPAGTSVVCPPTN